MSLSLAAGGFAVGIVCAVAAVNVASDFVRPVAMEPEPVVEQTRSVQPIPVYSASSAQTAGTAAGASEGEATVRNRTRSTARVALPTIGRAVPVASETDGSGGDAAAKRPAVAPTGGPVAKADSEFKPIRNDTKIISGDTAVAREETKVAVQEPTPQAATGEEETKPDASVKKPAAATRRRAAKPRRQYVREERRRERPQPTYAARYRAGPVYGSNGAPVFGYFPY